MTETKALQDVMRSSDPLAVRESSVHCWQLDVLRGGCSGQEVIALEHEAEGLPTECGKLVAV